MGNEEETAYGAQLKVFEQRLDHIAEGMEKLNDNLEKFTNTFVPRPEIDLMLRERDIAIKNVKENLRDMEQDKWSLRRLWPAWIAVLISLFSWIFNNK